MQPELYHENCEEREKPEKNISKIESNVTPLSLLSCFLTFAWFECKSCNGDKNDTHTHTLIHIISRSSTKTSPQQRKKHTPPYSRDKTYDSMALWIYWIVSMLGCFGFFFFWLLEFLCCPIRFGPCFRIFLIFRCCWFAFPNTFRLCNEYMYIRYTKCENFQSEKFNLFSVHIVENRSTELSHQRFL